MLKNLINILYPAQCLICKRTTAPSNLDCSVCVNCWNRIEKNRPPCCKICGRHMGAGFASLNVCPKCRRTNYHFDRAFSPCVYQGAMKELIHLFKYKGKIYLGKPLSDILAGFIKARLLPIDMVDTIVPVPLHTRKLREREFNQAQILTKYVAEEFDKKVSFDNLYRIKDNPSQITLTDAQRWENVKGIFGLKEPSEFKNKVILLVDDVFTTGATISEAAYILKNGGANVIFALTLAN